MTENLAQDAAPAGRARRVSFTVVAAIAALLTGVLTVGSLGQLVGGVTPDGSPMTADGRLVALVHVPWLALGWCAAFVALLWQARQRVAPYQQAVAMLGGLYIGGLLARLSDPVFYVGFGVVVLLLGVLHPAGRAVWRPGADGISPVLVPFALLLAAPCTLYAIEMTNLQAQAGSGGTFYTAIAATALAVPLVGLVAGLRAPGWRLPLWVTGGMLFLLVGSGAAADPAAPASPPTGWILAGLVAAVAFVGLGEWEAQRLARDPGPASPGSDRHPARALLRCRRIPAPSRRLRAGGGPSARNEPVEDVPQQLEQLLAGHRRFENPLGDQVLGEGEPGEHQLTPERVVGQLECGQRDVHQPAAGLLVDLRHPRVAAAGAAHEGQVALPERLHPADVTVEHPGDLLLRRRLVPGEDVGHQQVGRGAGDRGVVLALGREVVEQQAAADARPAGHLVDGELLHRRGGQQLEPDLHQLRPPVAGRATRPGMVGTGRRRHDGDPGLMRRPGRPWP
ncbi:membrane protein of unknown function [Blastococcus saxobsidens DD2]|uniref:Uncharacterized protein n=1 Tax=Blastococcus saxobsidens (strain DD2) TaxID=1146883 RepID=H6RSU0_BLASD|nr:membrane protein of unknown function [Blastococcus saxobsidens DD2]